MAFLSKSADAVDGTVINQIGSFLRHVLHTVDDEKLRVYFGKEVEYFHLQLSISGETEVDDWMLQLSVDDVSPYHAWARSTGTLGDGGSVYHNRLFLRNGQKRELASFGYADFQPFHFVVRRQE